MESHELDWAALERLRAGFLGTGGASTRADYWDCARTLASYDATFGERIGWKWDAVLARVSDAGWRPPRDAVLVDWGCGTGIATRRVLDAFGAETFASVRLVDRSRAALEWAAARIAESAPGLTVERTRDDSAPSRAYVLLASHVLGELDEPSTDRLVRLARDAAAVLWVEPGTADVSRRLVAARASLRTAGLRVVSPCPHDGPCGMLAPERARDWCHFFAPPPRQAFTDAAWAEVGRRLKIDLRALPVSYVVMERGEPVARGAARRVIARARCHKGYCTYLSCGDDTVTNERVLRKEDRAFADALDAGGFALDDRSR